MRSVAACALEVGLRGVQPDDRATPLRQRRRYDTRATADVQRLGVSPATPLSVHPRRTHGEYPGV